MVRDALIIFRKEIRNIMRDRRAVFANYILPMILMPAVFFVLEMTTSQTERSFVETSYEVVIVNNDDPRLRALLDESLTFEEVSSTGDNGLVLAFPDGYRPGDSVTVELEWRSTSSASAYAADRIERTLAAYERDLMDLRLRELGTNLNELETIAVRRIDVAPPEAQGSGFLVAMLPYLVVIYLFAGSMSVALDATAGEKERGSLAILLVNQVSRGSIALGKVLYVVTSATINAVASFAGIIIAVSIIGDGALGADAGSLLTVPKLIALGLVFVSMAGVAASAMVLLGSLARSMKEGGAYVTPVYLVAILTGVGTLNAEASLSIAPFFVPVYNGIMAVKGILVSRFTLAQIGVTIGMNLVLLALLVAAVAALYRSERILDTTAR